jgi:hypothetical protein
LGSCKANFAFAATGAVFNLQIPWQSQPPVLVTGVSVSSEKMRQKTNGWH